MLELKFGLKFLSGYNRSSESEVNSFYMPHFAFFEEVTCAKIHACLNRTCFGLMRMKQKFWPCRLIYPC